MELQSIKRLLCVRVYPTAIWEDTCAKGIDGNKQVFRPEEELYAFAQVKPNSEGGFKQLISMNANTFLIRGSELKEMMQVEDSIYVKYLDYGDKASFVPEGIAVKKQGRSYIQYMDIKDFKAMYVWSEA